MQDANQGSVDPEFQQGIADLESSPHEIPSLPVGQWLRQNLFSSWGNSVLTLFGGFLAFFALRGVLNFVFSENRQWDAVRTNLRALMTLSYPESQYIRVWVSLGFVAGLAGLSAGLWANWGGVSVKRLSTWLMGSGGLLAVCVIVREPSVIVGSDGKVVRTLEGSLQRESFLDAMVNRSSWWIAAIVLLVAGIVLWRRFASVTHRGSELAVTSVVFPGPWIGGIESVDSAVRSLRLYFGNEIICSRVRPDGCILNEIALDCDVGVAVQFFRFGSIAATKRVWRTYKRGQQSALVGQPTNAFLGGA